MILPRYCAYVDESGNTSLEFGSDGVSTHYIIVSVIAATEKQAELTDKLEEIRKSHFQTGEIKSSKVAKNDTRRQKILDDLVKLEWKCVGLVVDKRSLNSKGFSFKGSFVKHLQGRLYKQLFQTYPDLKIYADQYGRDSFLNGFTKYVEERHKPTLFERSGIEFCSSKDVVGIQLADFVAGTLARGYEQKNLTDPDRQFLKQLIKSGHLLNVHHYPFPRQQFKETSLSDDPGYQEEISETAYNAAVLYLEEHDSDTNEEAKCHCAALEFLLMHFVSAPLGDYLPTHEIITHISEVTGVTPTIRQFRGVIGKLRDDGILIASSKDGYRIPSQKADIWNFLRHQNNIVGPIIGRVKKCRERVKTATLGKLDVLEEPEFALLKQLVEGDQVK